MKVAYKEWLGALTREHEGTAGMYADDNDEAGRVLRLELPINGGGLVTVSLTRDEVRFAAAALDGVMPREE